MIGLEITVNGAILTAKRPVPLVRNGRDQYIMVANLDSTWDGLVPYACFAYGDDGCKVKIEDGQCTIPDEALMAGKFTLGVAGVGESYTYSTNLLVFTTMAGADTNGEIPPSPTPSEWESYVLIMEDAVSTATSSATAAEAAAVTAVAESTTAVTAATTASEMAEIATKAVDGIVGATGADGANGVTFTPSVSEDGDLSWTNDGDLENPTTVNLKGDKGDKGDTGETGATGQDGADGANGIDGIDGSNGVTFTPSVSEDGDLSWTNDGDLENPTTVNIKGEKGDAGEAGASGADGTNGVDGQDGADGADGADGTNGTDGADGQDGTDGQSAYEAAQEGGYTGSESDFNDALANVGDLNAVLDLLNGEVI